MNVVELIPQMSQSVLEERIQERIFERTRAHFHPTTDGRSV